MKLYKIRDWEQHFENNRTRELKSLTWVPFPNRHDGDGYTAVLSLPNGPAIYGAWVACVQVASKCDPRGTLMRDGARPHTSVTLARMTRFPVEIIEDMLTQLSTYEIGWITVEESTTCENPAPSCDAAALACASRARAEGKGREGNRREVHLQNSIPLGISIPTEAGPSVAPRVEGKKPDGSGNGQTDHFKSVALANRILGNSDGWDYDNCKVDRRALKIAPLASVIEPFVSRVTPDQLVDIWADSVLEAHGAKVDGLAGNATAYCIGCFKKNLASALAPQKND